MELNNLDRKILAHLYYHSRDPSTRIAKTLKTTPGRISYRINKLEAAEIIKGYLPLVGYRKLGYALMSLIFFSLKNKDNITKLKERIRKDSRRIITIETVTEFDIGALYVFKDEQERIKHLSEILEKNKEYLASYNIFEPYVVESYPLKFLGSSESSPYTIYGSKEKEYTLDNKEISILSELNKNANMRIIDISSKTGISAELIVHKMRKLKKEGILLSARAYYDMEKIGYFYSLIFIDLHSFSSAKMEKLRDFAKSTKNIDSFMAMMGSPNFCLQAFHKNMGELHQILFNLKNKFPDEIIGLKVIPLKNEGEDINSIPFL